MGNALLVLGIAVVALAAGSILGYLARQSIARKRVGSIEAELQTKTEEARKKEQELLLAAREKASQIVEQAKREQSERQAQLLKIEEGLLRKEESLEKRLSQYEVDKKVLEDNIEKVKEIKLEVEKLKQEEIKSLEKVASLTAREAKEELFKRVEAEYAQEFTSAVKKLEQDRKEQLENKAKNIMTVAIQRYARSHVADVTTTLVDLPSEDVKGKIIGREGRNIRTLERLTGVEIIVDDTPGSITISSFDPVRREVAKIALQKLIADGRIQPARIEEKVNEAQEEINKEIVKAGEAATEELGVFDFPKPIVQLIGRLKFRTSYGQNVLLHSVEMAHIAGMLAAELGANVEVAKRGALVHDLGKAIDHEVAGTHLELGRKILQKYKVDEAVVKAMESHHEDYPFATPEAYIVTAADAISGARPGARRDTLENYIKRLEELEKIATDFEGVEKAYALQAGREIRIFVVPEKIDDVGAVKLAHDVAKRIEGELKYPGEIKVNVIRETRAVEFAR
ncbi:ribonuclease Y [Candidatus Parcubacteria bacterium]|nr:MAG: ribonuclease Y [Candidatus Parcubacteria bacterium]